MTLVDSGTSTKKYKLMVQNYIGAFQFSLERVFQKSCQETYRTIGCEEKVYFIGFGNHVD